MMGNGNKSVAYTATPAQIAFPFVPVPRKRISTGKTPGSLDVNRIRFPATSIIKADEKTTELLKHCEWLYGARRLEEFLKMVREKPYLTFNPRIREFLLEIAQLKRKVRPFGRPSGIYREHPLIVAAMVEELTSKRIASNRQLAFAWLQRFGISATTARDLWYRAWRDPRFQPLFCKQEALTHPATSDEIAALEQAEVLVPGSTVGRTVLHPIFGKMTVSLTAAEPEKDSDNT